MSTRSVLGVCVLSMVLGACVDSRIRSGRDAGREDDGGGPPPPPPGALSLDVEGAAWLDDSTLLVVVRVGNGAGADPAPLAPSFFALGIAGGAELTASGGVGTNACRAELAVGAAGSVSCELAFGPVVGTPEVVHYRLPERMASAPIVACSASAPGGLCSAGQVCQSGACVAPCSFSQPDGACASSSDICVDGSCEPRCSPSVPDGACEVGFCRGGTCDTTCRSVNLSATGCYDCLLPIYDGTSPCGLASDTCLECAQCPAFSGTTDCECLATAACGGCAPEVSAIWDCAVSLCPVCFD